MKFDIVRAWKDEAYRQTLSEEQLETLAANPVGELNETELAAVCGGDDFPGEFGFGAAAASASSRTHTHSFSVLCDINVFSLERIKVINIDDLFNIANVKKQVCINVD